MPPIRRSQLAGMMNSTDAALKKMVVNAPVEKEKYSTHRYGVKTFIFEMGEPEPLHQNDAYAILLFQLFHKSQKMPDTAILHHYFVS
jgi:hypothetical protein